MRTCEQMKEEDYKPICYVGGTFDLTHFGHYRLFKRIKELGFHVFVAVNSDSFVKEYRGTPCIMNETERFNAVIATNDVDEAVIVDKKDQKDAIIDSQASVIAVGHDWLKPEILPQLGIDINFLTEENIGLLIMPRTEGISTSELKKRIQK